MSNFSKIVIIILLVLSFFFIKEKYGSSISNVISSLKSWNKIELPDKKPVRQPSEIVHKPVSPNEAGTEPIEKEKIYVYFLALDSNANVVYKKVERELPNGEDKLEYAIKELLKGPGIIEKSAGAYSEIPHSTKLLSIRNNGNKIIIDFSSDFQYGGGTDSIYSRMMQLIKTALSNTNNKE
ncbi:MAG: GerMN domain-containing protein, partial [Candidatus Gastranaerophilales bacterium]|nr:GerMN domain-containing protein [Candidatus Gastranaerophilales bacterium]